MVPRGTDARLFKEMVIVGNPQFTKACVGAVQLGLATLQLVSAASNPRVAAYGYGSYVYTIIPYAIGSIINIIAAVFTSSYVDLTEFELKAGEDESAEEEEDKVSAMLLSTNAVILELAVYLAIVGGITRFRPGISSRAQRGWFVLWAVVGTIYGVTLRSGILRDEDEDDKWFHSYVFSFCAGAAAIGGVVAMIQQYLHLFQC